MLIRLVISQGWHMAMNPGLEALYARQKQKKGAALPRFRIWAKSSVYFHKAYSGYGHGRRELLLVSRAMGLAVIGIQQSIRKLKG